MRSPQFISTIALFICLPSTTCVAQHDKDAKQTDDVDRNRVVLSQRSGLKRYIQLRAFEDPCTHLRWILLEDLNHPAAPRILSQDHGIAGIELARAPAIHRGD